MLINHTLLDIDALNDAPNSMYENALLAMSYLLREVGLNHWLEWIERDLTEWRTSRDTSHHRSAYGAMGSFNDVFISIPSSKSEEAWANETFQWLKSLCFTLSRTPDKTYSLRELKSKFSLPDANSSPLQGWRCLQCGYGEVQSIGVEYFVASRVVPSLMLEGCASGDLKDAIEKLLKVRIENLESERNKIRQIAQSSGLHVKDRDDWMRPCPSCSSDDTAVYRWYQEGARFVAGKDNLPVRRRRSWRNLLKRSGR